MTLPRAFRHAWLLCLALPLAAHTEVATAGGIPDAPDFDFNVPTPEADYLVQSISQPASAHYFPPLKVLSAALALDNAAAPVFGTPNGYHSGYVDRGFRTPYFSGDRLAQFYDCKTEDDDDADCDNGLATLGRILMPVTVYDTASNSCIRGVIGHELFHHVEFAYADAAGDSGCSGWIGSTACEGQARSLQDKIYIDLDLDPEASCAAPYLGQVDSFLGDTNRNLWAASYSSALWWTYLSEQYGTVAVEPHRGIDFLVRWWELAEDEGEFPDALAVTDATIREFEPAHHVKAAFHDFSIANIVKDLDLSSASANFRNRYSYRDEDPLFLLDNQMHYAEVPRDHLVVPVNGTRALRYTVTNHGADYQEWDVSNCPSGHLIRFETDPDHNFIFGDSYYTITGVVTARGEEPMRPIGLYKNRSRGWSTEILQPFNRIDMLYSVVAGWSSFSFGELRVSCVARPAEPEFPLLNPINPFTPGPPETLSAGEVHVDVHDPGTPRDRGLRALSADQFEVAVGGQPAQVIAATSRDSRYTLQLRFPTQAEEGVYPLTVRVGDTTTTVPDAISHDALHPQALLAIDTSTSMGLPSPAPRLDATKRAARAFIDVLGDDAALGLIEHYGNNIEPGDDAFVRQPLASLTAAQRTQLHGGVESLTIGGARTSGIGDALRIAIGEFTARALPRQARHLVLLADGPEADADLWEDLEDDVLAAGIAVHAIALGPQADQPLLERIARRTGGDYHYVDITTAPDEAALHDAFARIADRLMRRQRIAQQGDLLPQPTTATTLRVRVPRSERDGGTFQLRIAAPGTGAETLGQVRVFDPNGVERIDGVDGTRIVRRPRFLSILDRTRAGEWTVSVLGVAGAPSIAHAMSASVHDDGQTSIRATIRRDADDPETIDDLLSGDSGVVQIGLLLPAVQAARESTMRVRHPDGSLQTIRLNDDGEHGDALGGDNVWSGRYRRLTAGAPTGFADGPSAPAQRGSYAAEVTTTLATPATALDSAKGGSIPTETLSLNFDKITWTVLDQGALADADSDGMPNRYEQRQACVDPALADGSMDADRDGRPSLFEMQDGTDPCDADSDGGGETDASERSAGREPLDPSDDALCPIDVAYIDPPADDHEEMEPAPANALRLRFSTCARNEQIEVRRGLSPTGPLQEIARLDASVHRGTWWNTNLVPGTTYWYQLVAHRGTSTGTPSAIFSGVARVDPAAPIGSLRINDGRPRTDDARLHLSLSVYNKPESSTQMRVAVEGGEYGAWQPFDAEFEFDVLPATAPIDVSVAVQLRDAEQHVSDALIDDIRLYPAGALGTLTLRAVDAAGTPQAGVLVWFSQRDSEATAISAADGSATLIDLKPGSYALRLDAPDGRSAQRQIQMVAGGALALGDVGLDAAGHVFGDGFE
jgi:hypothetical protein